MRPPSSPRSRRRTSPSITHNPACRAWSRCSSRRRAERQWISLSLSLREREDLAPIYAGGRQILRRFAPKDKLMINLIENETLKILRRRRFTVVVAILFAILAVVTYSQYQRLIN